MIRLYRKIRASRWFLVIITPLLTACQIPGSGGDEVLTQNFERQSININIEPQAEVSWFEAGPEDARPVIYVHGTPGSAGAWASYLTNPIEGLHAISFDRPGFGISTPNRAYPSLTDQAAVIDAFVADNPSGLKPILVGHSLGGPIVARYAADHPDRVGGIVLVAASLDPGLERVRPIQWVGCVPPFVWLLPSQLRNANRELIPLEAELEDLETVLSQIQCPIVIIHGTEDTLVPYANVPFMEQKFTGSPSVRLITIDGANHFIPWTHEPTIRSAIIELADELNARP
jgi:pimeloyl-ACP methyl ester carboxylesterase